MVSVPTTSTSPSPNEVAPAPTLTSCRGLQLSELVPNPVGVDTDEFIEVLNGSDEDVPAAGCSVWTSATRKYVLADDHLVLRGGRIVLKKAQTKLTLNNGGTTVRLLDVDGTEIDRTTYAAAPEGQSWSLIAGTWKWTTLLTPSDTNQLRLPPPKPVTTRKVTPARVRASAQPAVPVALPVIQDLDSGDRVSVRGIITTPVGALGATMSYIQAEDGAVAISIPNDLPALHVGETVRVTGTVRLKQGRRYVAVSAKGLTVTAPSQTVEPLNVQTDDIGTDQADRLVEVRGVVSLASGNSIEVDDGSGPTTIYLKSSTGIVKPKVKAGDTVRAIGIVSVSTSGVRVLPRSQDDLHVEHVLGVATTSAAPAIVAASNPRQALWYWLTAMLGGAVVGAKPAWRALRKKRTEQL
ncbi:MAG: lamin tail domain-containing protein [Candidatus Kerfeldbacteria bacterium]|nr:lamin tail domain-containing protein [Candidatus Kerfeldbacteria bacterium]